LPRRPTKRETASSCVALLALAVLGCGRNSAPPQESPEFLKTLALEAAQEGRVDAIKELLNRGVSPDTFETDTHDGDTLLIISCRKNNRRLAQTLLEAGACVDLRQHGNRSDLTPLVSCASAGHQEIVELLLDHGANVNGRVGIDGAGPTALFEAAYNGHVGVATVLLASGAIVDRREMLAAISHGHVEIVERLLHAGGDPRWVLSNGRTVLEEAQQSPAQMRVKMTATVRHYLGR